MAAEEDILIKEVDEELKQDQTVAFFKKYGAVLIGAAVLVVAVVAGLQIRGGMTDRAEGRNAEIYQAAVDASEDDLEGGADLMLAAAEETGGGYAALARLRAASFLLQNGESEKAITALAKVAEDGALPMRLRDLARMRMAVLLIDEDPARASALAGEVETATMLPLAKEVRAIAALTQENYETAYALFTELAAGEGAGVGSNIAMRARLLAPVADAGRQGVALEPQGSEAEDFIQSFSEDLMDELAAPDEGGPGETSQEPEAAEDNEAPDGDTP